MKIDRKLLTKLSLGYVYIPIVLFLFGWTKIWIACLCAAAIGVAGYRLFFRKDKEQDKKEEKTRPSEEEVRVSPLVFCIVLFVIVAGLYYSGLGRFVFQSYDWYKHNSVLSDLSSRSWPVYYHNHGETTMLAYYLAQYMLPGLLGKITGSFRVAEIAYYFLGVAGLLLVWCHVVSFLKFKKSSMQILTIVFLFLFCTPQTILAVVFPILFGDKVTLWSDFYLPQYNIVLQYTDNFDLIRFVFSQSVSIWLIFLLFLENKKNIRTYVFLMLPGIFFGVFPFLGMLPFALGQAVTECVQRKEKKSWFQELFSLENLSIAATLGTVLFFYFLGNVMTEKPASVSFALTPFSGRIQYYFIYVLIAVILPMSFLLKKHCREVFFYITLGILLILPFFRMGKYNDLMMRGSIPALFLLMLYMLVAVSEMKKPASLNAKMFADLVLIIVIISGMITPFIHLFFSVLDDEIGKPGELLTYVSLEYLATRDDQAFIESYQEGAGLEYQEKDADAAYADIRFNYFTYDPEESIFYKYIAREKDSV